MPTIGVSKRDLLELVGKRSLSDEELAEALEMVKAEVKALGPDEITLEVTADRADMFSVEGIARSLKGFLEVELGAPKYPVREVEEGFVVEVDKSVRGVRPFVACAAVLGCPLGEEGLRQLIQLQEVLHRTHGRNRKKFAIGLHNFDVVRTPIVYTAKRFEEFKFTPLEGDREMNGKEIIERHPKGMEYGWIIKDKGLAPLLIDANGNILSMPPIINSEYTKVSTRTRNLFIDVTGTDLKAVEDALAILVANLAERGGQIVRFEVREGQSSKRVEPKTEHRLMTVSYNRLIEVTGIEVPLDEVVRCLMKSRLDAIARGEHLDVAVPFYRVDVMDDVDVAEDFAIGYGYNRIIPDVPSVTTRGRELELVSFSRLCRELMIGYGFQEVLNYMFTSDKKLDDACVYEKRVRVAKPVSSDYTCLRTSLIPPLLDFLSENTHMEYPQKIFEIGDVVIVDETFDERSLHDKRMAALHADYKAGYEDVQAVLYSFLRILNVKFVVKRDSKNMMIEGRCASVLVNGEVVGLIGEIRPEVLLRFGLQTPVAAFEISLSKLYRAWRTG
ncbi:MAG: phenylalanine--tRNA ligase subunit beta [Candidatus Verstraetearchaeota archaeon]|jgi:phenylalanyl-tRNA synthetase beta chain|nr:phenylalanine--tRNA ligase subunit beta [Candidatus Verstraetearchaeota archaeon]